MPRTYRPKDITITLLSLAFTLALLTTYFTFLRYSEANQPAPARSDQINRTLVKRPGAHPGAETNSLSDTSFAPTTGKPAPTQISEAYGKLPLSFEANAGQTDGQVKFLSRGNGYGLFLTSTEAVIQLRKAEGGLRIEKAAAGNPQSAIHHPQSAVLRMEVVGANAAARVEGRKELPGKSHYFIGSDPAKWRTDISNYAQVHYRGVYPGVDLVYYGNQRQLEYDFIVAPGADPSTIRLAFEGLEKIEVNAQGDLVLHTAGGEVRMQKPIAYQEAGGGRQEIASHYVLLETPSSAPRTPDSKLQTPDSYSVGFEVAEYDASQPLVIDPVLSYSTFLGGNGFDEGTDIAVDSSGNAYVTGYTSSTNFPRSNPFQANGSYEAFITKLNPSGNALVYSTYLGGLNLERASGIVVDSSGNAFVTGHTNSSDFPTTSGAYDSSYNGGYDAFITKLSATGNALVYSTFLGGSNDENTDDASFGFYRGGDIDIDSSGNAYITGDTVSDNFPKVNAYQPTRGSYRAAFVTKLNAAGSALVYSTYLYPAGALEAHRGTGIAVDSSNSAYVGSCDNYAAYATKFSPAGSSIVYSNRYGGTDGGGISTQEGVRIAVDAAGNAHLTGATTSFDFPTTPDAYQPEKGGKHDIFVLKVNSTGSALVYGTFIGGRWQEFSGGIEVNDAGQAYVIGSGDRSSSISTRSVDVYKLDAGGTTLMLSMSLGRGEGRGIAIDASGNAYITGFTSWSSFQTTPGAFQTTLGQTQTGNTTTDAFVAKISGIAATPEYYQIRGRVTDQNTGIGIFQATITVSNSSFTATALTDYDGYYSVYNVPVGGTYTVTPSHYDPYTFTPQSQTVTNLSGNTVVNFTGTKPPGNAPPTVNITSPANNQNFTAPANITISADASDVDGTVSKVDFFANGTLIGTDTTAPYSMTWNNVGAGEYTFLAVATDNQGATGTSTQITITVSQSLFSIGGRVTQTNGEGLGGVVIALNGAQSQTTTTDANGYYSFANLEQGGNYTVMPTKGGYTFNPPSQSVNGLVSNQTLNFTALPITSGNVLISEFRLRGPNGSNDEFIELYNNTNSPITVGALDGSSGWALVAANGVTVFTIPNNTTIPARAHYLVVNSNPVGGYSLGSYAAGDNAYVVDILDDTGIALFKTSNPSNFTLENRLDAVGFNNGFTPVPELYREGSGLPPIGAVVAEHSWVRKIITVGGVPRTGLPQDTNENASDFVLVSPTAETLFVICFASGDGLRSERCF